MEQKDKETEKMQIPEDKIRRTMKIKNIENPEEFLKVIDSCTGRVELITDDGDRLNLKSKLCQLVSLSTIFSSAAKIPEMEIVAHELEDSKKIMDYLMGC